MAKCNTLFYNTLFDENASCHLAIGKGYPSSVKNGAKLSEKELEEKGLNDSVEHVDFMIGSLDLNIYGIKKDGEFIDNKRKSCYNIHRNDGFLMKKCPFQKANQKST